MDGPRKGRGRYRNALERSPRNLTNAARCYRLLATNVQPTAPRICRLVWLMRADKARYEGAAAMQQVADWLEKLGLGQYAQRFAENDIPLLTCAIMT
jgi:hypothetical protein